MISLALNGCMWCIVSMTGFRVGSQPTIVAISSLRVNEAFSIKFKICFGAEIK